MFSELTSFVLGAGFNLLIALLIVRLIYYPVTKNKNYVFTFLAFSTITYFVLGLFTSTTLSVGVGFGLFAIFSVLRYRTEEMPTREMTYLFIIIALSVMNSILMLNGELMKLFVSNGTVVALLYVLEKEWGFHFEASTKITYEKVDLITPDHRDDLLADLRQRTGLSIRRVEVGRLDFLHDSAEIKIYYDKPQASAQVIVKGD
ncbi:MAG: DUF4956 domain-containing protein [Anaerolineae bacterium]|nr:DUF4956 domain-containing protein [Anaerolineae bacterium]